MLARPLLLCVAALTAGAAATCERTGRYRVGTSSFFLEENIPIWKTFYDEDWEHFKLTEPVTEECRWDVQSETDCGTESRPLDTVDADGWVLTTSQWEIRNKEECPSMLHFSKSCCQEYGDDCRIGYKRLWCRPKGMKKGHGDLNKGGAGHRQSDQSAPTLRDNIVETR